MSGDALNCTDFACVTTFWVDIKDTEGRASCSKVYRVIVVNPFQPGDAICHHAFHLFLTLRLLMSYIYGAPSKARNANVVYIWTYVWQR